MTLKKGILAGCGCAALLAALGALAVVLWVAHVSRDPEGVRVAADGPIDVLQGEEFTLTVRIVNERADKPFKLGDIDVGTDYLDRFVLLGVEPEPRSTMDNRPYDDSRSFTFDTQVPAGQTAEFRFRLRAEKAGIQRGDIDVCEGPQFLTTFAQTVVRTERDGPVPRTPAAP